MSRKLHNRYTTPKTIYNSPFMAPNMRGSRKFKSSPVVNMDKLKLVFPIVAEKEK